MPRVIPQTEQGQAPNIVRQGRAAHARERAVFRTHRVYSVGRGGARLIAAAHVAVGKGVV